MKDTQCQTNVDFGKKTQKTRHVPKAKHVNEDNFSYFGEIPIALHEFLNLRVCLRLR